MKQLTSTKAMYRDVAISVSSERFNGTIMFSCATRFRNASSEDKWFATQGEAIANERHAIDDKLGLPPWRVDNPETPGSIGSRRAGRGGRR